MNDRFSKPALGRGLGDLMEAARPATVAEEPAPGPASLSPGMATLLRRPEEPSATPAVRPPSRRLRWTRLSLVLADALFVGCAVRTVLKADGPLGFWGLALCTAAMLMGAWLFYLACHFPGSSSGDPSR